MKRDLLILGLLASACDRDRPPAPTAEQHGQLDEAEDMLNDIAADGAGNEKGPEAMAPDPSANAR